MAVNWTGALLSGYGLWDQADRLGDIGANVADELRTMSSDYRDAAAFTPFGVAGYGGNATVGQNGDINVNLNSQQQALADQLTSGAQGLFSSATGSQDQRIGDAYEAIRRVQRPEEERAGSALESRLMAQGRAGITSNQYGGTPEMLAYQKAVAEAKNNAALSAIGEARAQQLQDANIGTQFQTNSWLPQANMLNLINPGLNAAQLSQAGQLGGLNLGAQLGLGGLQTQVNTEKVRAELLGGLFNTLGMAANDQGFDPVSDVVSSLWGALFGG